MSGERRPLVERFPQLVDLESKDDDQLIEIFRNVLDGLRRDLDDKRED